PKGLRRAPVRPPNARPVLRDLEWSNDVPCIAELGKIGAGDDVPIALEPGAHELGTAETLEPVLIPGISPQQNLIIGQARSDKEPAHPPFLEHDSTERVFIDPEVRLDRLMRRTSGISTAADALVGNFMRTTQPSLELGISTEIAPQRQLVPADPGVLMSPVV